MPLHDLEKYRLMAPGPVPMSEKVQKALALPMIHHRTPEFDEILKQALEGLKWIFQTEQPVLILPTTGSGGMEAALVNTLSQGDEILCVVSGKFGERWKTMADIYGVKTEVFNVPWGESLDLTKFENQLKQKPYKAVLTQVSETSTATLNPIEQMSQLIKRTQTSALFMVDAISAIGCTPLPMDQWGLDVVVAGSQKAFALPTGLSFVALSKKAWAANSTAKLPRFYLDLKLELEANKRGETHFSSQVLIIRALNAALQDFRSSGLETMIRDVEKRANATRKAALALGLKIFSESPSPSVTAVRLPDGLKGAELRSLIEQKYKVTLMGGQDHMKGKILRFGHMGAITPDDVLASIEALALGLREMGVEMPDKTIVAALSVAREALS